MVSYRGLDDDGSNNNKICNKSETMQIVHAIQSKGEFRLNLHVENGTNIANVSVAIIVASTSETTAFNFGQRLFW